MNVDELLRWGDCCQAAGDLEGAVDAYRQADELGDAEGAILLGEIYRKRGDSALAEQAYARSETRGHRDAAMCLGMMLSDLGQHDAAKAAYERAIAAGSNLAVLNLGLMLAEQGKTEAALVYLQRADASGDAEAAWAIGKIRESQSDLAGAAEAYRRAADAGDPSSAYSLGRALYGLGDVAGARAAFLLARDLGYADVEPVIEALGREADDAGSIALARKTNELLSAVGNLITEIAHQRSALRKTWIASSLPVQIAQARQTALVTSRDRLREQLSELVRQFGVSEELDRLVPTQSLSGAQPDQWLSLKVASAPGAASSWELAPAVESVFAADLGQARKALFQARSKRFAPMLKATASEALGRFSHRLRLFEEAIGLSAKEIADAERKRTTEAASAATTATQGLAPIQRASAAAIEQLPPILQPWTSNTWSTWTPDQATGGLRIGFGGWLTTSADDNLGSNSSIAADLSVPYSMSLFVNRHICGVDAATTHGFVRSLMLRQLVSLAPGELQFCVFDPIGLGQSVGDLLDLTEYDSNLIGGKVWTTTQDLDTRLTELAGHIELVIQKYLRSTYDTIDEYNTAAGEVAEPYRVLTLFNFPSGLSGDATAKLASIAGNGPRCGVYTVIASDVVPQLSQGVDASTVLAAMPRLNVSAGFSETVDGYELKTRFGPDLLPERSSVAKRIIELVGREVMARTEVAVTFDKTFDLYRNVVKRGLRVELSAAAASVLASDPKTWWQVDSTSGLFAPIGQKGARDAAILGFDSSDHSGALLVGRPGAGKSTLLHAYIGGLTTLYSPEELELYLIDFKEGVEFKAYAEEGLPHAKVIAIESDREFGLSVLESLQAEIGRRGDALQGTGGRQADMQALREATKQRMPRILLVFDEFQVLFARNDKVGLAAADLLESIVRQGRGFGVHVLLGSQSLAGLDALGTHVPQLLPVRILLPAAEADARKVLGESNTAGDYLTSHGEGILNAAGGASEANERFKGALLAEPERIARLQVMREKANQEGFIRTPLVFEGNAIVPMDTLDPRRFFEELAASGTSPIRLRHGVPMSVGDVGDIVLSREAGSHVLVVVRAADTAGANLGSGNALAHGVLTAAVASAAMTSSSIDIIDFLSVDDGLDSALEPQTSLKLSRF